jgi:wyosine [tRNA(Phe)-imidazoG37] synthetase (radical SAM superfamily)
MHADLVIPSLDAGCAYLYKYINRPHRQIPFDKMLKGLIQFRQEFTGEYWLEVMMLAGVTTPTAEVGNLAQCIQQIGPDKVQVNSVTGLPARVLPRQRRKTNSNRLPESCMIGSK